MNTTVIRQRGFGSLSNRTEPKRVKEIVLKRHDDAKINDLLKPRMQHWSNARTITSAFVNYVINLSLDVLETTLGNLFLEAVGISNARLGDVDISLELATSSKEISVTLVSSVIAPTFQFVDSTIDSADEESQMTTVAVSRVLLARYDVYNETFFCPIINGSGNEKGMEDFGLAVKAALLKTISPSSDYVSIIYKGLSDEEKANAFSTSVVSSISTTDLDSTGCLLSAQSLLTVNDSENGCHSVTIVDTTTNEIRWADLLPRTGLERLLLIAERIGDYIETNQPIWKSNALNEDQVSNPLIRAPITLVDKIVDDSQHYVSPIILTLPKKYDHWDDMISDLITLRHNVLFRSNVSPNLSSVRTLSESKAEEMFTALVLRDLFNELGICKMPEDFSRLLNRLGQYLTTNSLSLSKHRGGYL